MTEQCKIYLDPWDKTDLEGTAMLIGRMPDITDRIYRGVTCQRWFVRFVPDQDIVFRWLDYADAEPYIYPIQNSTFFAWSLAELITTDATPTSQFPKVGEVTAEYWASALTASYLIPKPGALISLAISYITEAASGGANLIKIATTRNTTALTSRSLYKSTTVGGPYAQFHYMPSPLPLQTADRFVLFFWRTQPAGESATLSNIIATAEIAWGDFT